MRVIVTRPEAQALDWVQQLAAHGIDAVALPLIEIAPPADPAAVKQSWRELDVRRLIVFVSPNAARQFFALRPAEARWPDALTAASIGPGTTRVLQQLGVAPSAIVEPAPDAPQFDSEALWQQLADRDWADASVLIVRGEGGREWLANMLRARGARVDFVSAYRRAAPQFDDARAALLAEALRAPRGHLWFFSSSEAITHLLQACPEAAWHDAEALATHPRIAACAAAGGFGRVHASRPALADVIACIQSIAS
jgi:uroporphyrinogen-III synthase